MKLSLFFIFFIAIRLASFAQISFNLEVEQSVQGNELILDFIVERPAGSTDFAFGSSNFSVFVNASALNIPGMYKDPAFDGPWDNDNNPTNYFDVSVGHNNSNYVNMNINYIVGSPGTGTTVPVGRTRIGRIRIPITDPTQCNSINWRIPPLAIKKHDGTSIKSFANFINSTYCLPLCSDAPIFTQAVTNVCSGKSLVFATQNASTCSLVVANGTANVQISPLDSSNHLLQFSGVGNLTLRFIGTNGCFKDTIVQVNENPQLVSFNNLCSGGTFTQFSGNLSPLNWSIIGYDSTLSFSDTSLLGNQSFNTQINGHGFFTLLIEDPITHCSFDTLIEIFQMEIIEPQPIVLCNGDTFSIHLNNNVPYAQWLIPNSFVLLNGGMSLDSFVVLKTNSFGMDTIRVLGVDKNGCSYDLNYVVSVDTFITQFQITQSIDSLSQTIILSPYSPVSWYFNDTLLATNHDTLWVTQPGSYYAVYINNCGIYFSDTLNITPTFKNLSSNYQFSLYPNPNDGSFYVHLKKSGNYQLKIYDGIGKLIYQDKFYGNQHFIQLRNLTEGVYLLEIEGIGAQRWIYKK